MFKTFTMKEAINAVDVYKNSPTLEVGDGLSVYGSDRALLRVQAYILASQPEKIKREDINLYLANELKLSEATVKALREEVAAYKRYGKT
jgi:hypothetical protein